MLGPQNRPSHRRVEFLVNILWSWLSIFFSLVLGFFLSPFVIHRLGDERYGVWALVFSLINYYALADLGFRSAVVKYAAHYRAKGEADRLDSLISTAVAYFASAALLIVGASVILSHYAARIFRVLPTDESDLRFLTVTVGIGFAVGVVFSACTAVLEGHQRFDITSRILIVNNGVRVIGCFSVLSLGGGLKAMGLAVLCSQFTGHVLTYRALRRLLPDIRFSPRKISLSEFRHMYLYGYRTFLANMSLHILNQTAPVLIGSFLSATFVGYFVFPRRLLSYSADLVDRLGTVTGAKVAELTAHGDMQAISRMAVIVNRYCLMLFLPLAVFLAVFGRQLLYVWLNPRFAENSAPLLPVLGAGVAVAIAASYNCTSILYGLGKHGSLAAALVVEAALSALGLWYVIPRSGILGAACVMSGLMIAVRGLYVPYVVCRQLELNYWQYLGGIYIRPTAVMLPIALTAWLVNRGIGAPSSWTAVLSGGAAMTSCYYVLCFLTLEAKHREMILGSITPVLRGISNSLARRTAA